MIVAIAAAAAISAAFAPPIDVPIRYKLVEERPLRSGGKAHFTLHQTLRFMRDHDGYEATTVAGDHSTDASEPQRTLHDALLAPFTGVPTRVRIDAKGLITGVIDPAPTWAAILASQRAMLARMLAEPRVTDEVKARARTITAGSFEQATPAMRDAQLADAVAALLVPPLPALEPGEVRTLSAVQPIASGGTVTLASVTAAQLVYRVATRADLPVGSAGPTGLRQVELTELTVERATGLLLHAHTDRFVEAADGTRRSAEWDDLSREP